MLFVIVAPETLLPRWYPMSDNGYRDSAEAAIASWQLTAADLSFSNDEHHEALRKYLVAINVATRLLK